MNSQNLDDYILVNPTTYNFINLVGKVFGQLTVLSIVGNRKSVSPTSNPIYWLCRCSCGQEQIINGTGLRNHNVSRCDSCYREHVRKQTTTHGYTGKPEYISFHEAKKRCNNPKVIRYPQYGGRGIKFLFNSFEEFIAELGPKPSKYHSLDRIDVNGHYEKGNVRWADRKTQANNTRANHFITINGETKTMAEWADRHRLDVRLIDNRIRKMRWCEPCAASLPHYSSCPHR